MPISMPDPPQAVKDVLASSLNRMRNTEAVTMRTAAEAGGAPQLVDAHRVFTLGLTDLTQGAGPEGGVAQSWRYSVPQAAGSASVEVVDDARGGFAFGGFFEGLDPQLVHETIEWLKGLPEFTYADYELRALRVPGLLLEGIWLKAQQSFDDRFVVLRDHLPLKARTLYTTSELFPALREMAAVRMSFNDEPTELGPHGR